MMRGRGVVHSYSVAANPYDNAAVESFFSHFSTEFLADAYNKHPFHSVREMEERIEAYIGDYNSKRPHIYNDGKTPNEKEREWRRKTGGAVLPTVLPKPLVG